MDAPQQSLYLAVLITAIVLGIIIAFFVASLLRQQRRLAIMHRERVAAEIRTLEQERQRIARDLHDELGPVLLAIKYNINSFELPSPDDRQTLIKTNGTIDRMADQMRSISNDLVPQALLRRGWVAAVEEMLDGYRRNTPLSIDLQYDELPDWPAERTIQLYRAVQECLHNIIKHAQASAVQVSIHRKDGQLHLTVRDDGIGFDATRASMAPGLGLRSLVSRAEYLGGRLYIDTGPGRGTSLQFVIPEKQLHHD